MHIGSGLAPIVTAYRSKLDSIPDLQVVFFGREREDADDLASRPVRGLKHVGFKDGFLFFDRVIAIQFCGRSQRDQTIVWIICTHFNF